MDVERFGSDSLLCAARTQSRANQLRSSTGVAQHQHQRRKFSRRHKNVTFVKTYCPDKVWQFLAEYRGGLEKKSKQFVETVDKNAPKIKSHWQPKRLVNMASQRCQGRGRITRTLVKRRGFAPGVLRCYRWFGVESEAQGVFPLSRG